MGGPVMQHWREGRDCRKPRGPGRTADVPASLPVLGPVPVQAVAQVRPHRQRPRIAGGQKSRKDNPTNGRAPEFSLTGSPKQTRPIDTFLVPTGCQKWTNCVQSSHDSFVTLTHTSR